VIALGLKEHGEVGKVGGYFGVVGAESFFVYGEGALIKRFGGDALALQVEHQCEIVEVHGEIRVVGDEGFLVDGEGAAEEGFGAGIVLLVLEQGGEVVEVGGDGALVEIGRFLVDGESATEERLGGGVVAFFFEQGGEIGEIDGDGWVVGAERFFIDGEGAAEERLGLVVVAGVVEKLSVARSPAIVARTQESLRGELATRLSMGACDGRMMCTKNGVIGNFVGTQIQTDHHPKSLEINDTIRSPVRMVRGRTACGRRQSGDEVYGLQKL
jgi:hypothetical protein